MTITTTSYGSWVRATDSSAFTLDGEVADALLAGCDFNDYSDEQIAVVAAAYRAAINEALPPGVSLCGDEFYGPAYEKDCNFDGYPVDANGSLDIPAIIESVDFWGLVDEVLV